MKCRAANWIVWMMSLGSWGLVEVKSKAADLGGGGVLPVVPVVNVRAADAVAVEPTSLSSAAGPVLQEVNTAKFVVTRTGKTATDLTVYYTLGGTSSNGDDYKKQSGQVVISAGESSAPIFVVPVEDALVEGRESVVLSILPAPCLQATTDPLPVTFPESSCYQIGDLAKAEAWILDPILVPSETPVITVNAVDPEAREGLFPWIKAPTTFWTGAFEISRTTGTNVDLTVHYVLSGTAENGVDYQKLSGELLIPQGSWSTTVLVEPIDDVLVESTETVVLRIEPVACAEIFPPLPSCYSVGTPAEATVSIQDFDADNLPPKTDLVSPASGASFPFGTDIELVAQAADGDGYVPKVEFFDGEVKLGEVNVAFLVPPKPGQLQEFRFTWKDAPVGVHALHVVATDDGGAVTKSGITEINVVGDVIRPPTVTIVAKDPSAAEQSPLIDVVPNSGLFLVQRTAPLDFDLKVHLSFAGTALNGVDYEKISDEVVIPSGQESLEIRLNALDDAEAEPTETVVVSVVAPICPAIFPPPVWCYNVGKASVAEGYILDDEPRNFPPKVSVDRPVAGAVFKVGSEVLVQGQTADVDGYVPHLELWVDGKKVDELNIAFLVKPKPGQIQNYEFKWVASLEGAHELVVVAVDDMGASNSSGVVPIRVGSASDKPGVSVFVTDPVAVEGATPVNPAVVTVRRTGATDTDLTVWLELSGIAENGVDYEKLGPTVTIPAGQSAVKLSVIPLDDKARERAETVVVRLVEPPLASPLPSPYQLAWPGRATIVILDNDVRPGRFASLPNGFVLLQLPTSQGTIYRVEASEDMVHWTPTTLATAGEDGLILVEQQDHQDGHKFFRAMPELP